MKKLLLILLILYSTTAISEVITKTYEKNGVAYEVQLNINTAPALQCLDTCAESCLGDTNNEYKTKLLQLENNVLEAQNISTECDKYKGHTKKKCEEKLDKKIKNILGIK